MLKSKDCTKFNTSVQAAAEVACVREEGAEASRLLGEEALESYVAVVRQKVEVAAAVHFVVRLDRVVEACRRQGDVEEVLAAAD